jgi:hypothetical protein
MARRERDNLERAVHTIAEQAAKADELVDEAKAAGGGDHPVTVHAKMLRLELLKVKDPIPKTMEFLAEPGSEDWGSGLYRTLKAFFENQLPSRSSSTVFRSATDFFDVVPVWPQTGPNNGVLARPGRAYAHVDAVPPAGTGRKGRKLSSAFVRVEAMYSLRP